MSNASTANIFPASSTMTERQKAAYAVCKQYSSKAQFYTALTVQCKLSFELTNLIFSELVPSAVAIMSSCVFVTDSQRSEKSISNERNQQ